MAQTEQDYWYNRRSAEQHYLDREYEAKISKLNQDYEYALFAQLKPKLFKDGNQWCVLYGENIQEGICGFGETPYKAILAFNKAFNS